MDSFLHTVISKAVTCYNAAEALHYPQIAENHELLEMAKIRHEQEQIEMYFCLTNPPKHFKMAEFKPTKLEVDVEQERVRFDWDQTEYI